jgi:hypothetical protein
MSDSCDAFANVNHANLSVRERTLLNNKKEGSAGDFSTWFGVQKRTVPLRFLLFNVPAQG